jgi:hypothetical protein
MKLLILALKILQMEFGKLKYFFMQKRFYEFQEKSCRH